jgi:hypothetical protein
MPEHPATSACMHVWIGATDLDEYAFVSSFEETVSGTEDYDEDLLQVMWRPHEVAVRDLIEETSLREAVSIDRIVHDCAARGILTANAGFLYGGPSTAHPHGARAYAGLVYMGRYDD